MSNGNGNRSDSIRPSVTTFSGGVPPAAEGRTAPDLLASLRGKRSQRKGSSGEQAARQHLIGLGLRQVVDIPTKMMKLKGKWTFAKKALADIHAIAPGGIAVLAEVKSHAGLTLPWSELRPHQVANLDQHFENGGISLLIWNATSIIYVLPWQHLRAQCGPGRSISRAWAEERRLPPKSFLNWPSQHPLRKLHL